MSSDADFKNKHLALKILAVLLNACDKTETKIVSELLLILQSHSTSNLEPDILKLRESILKMFCFIFSNQKEDQCKDMFRTCGGIVWLSSALDGLGQILSVTEEPVNQKTISFLQLVIYTLGCVLESNPANRSYLRNEIRYLSIFQTVASYNFLEGDMLLKIFHPLLNLAIRNWPPKCSDHFYLSKASTVSIYLSQALPKFEVNTYVLSS